MQRKIEIRWSLESVQRTDEIINFLLKNWSEKEAIKFLKTLETFEFNVKRFPEMYPVSQQNPIYRRAVIVKQISIIYSIDGNIIQIHTLFDNRQNPDKLI